MDDDLKFLNDNILTIVEYKIYSKDNIYTPSSKGLLKNFLETHNKTGFEIVRKVYREEVYYSLTWGDRYLKFFTFAEGLSDLKMMVRKRKINALSSYK